MDFNTFKHSSPAGDLISVLPGMRQLWVETGRKSIIFQRLDMIGTNQVGIDNAFKNDNGEDVSMNETMFKMLRPFLLSQQYIQDFIVYDGQEVFCDLDQIRMRIFTNQPFGEIRNWVSYLVPQMRTDLSQQYIKPQLAVYSDKVILNYTDRYRNRFLHYNFLREHQGKLVFAGLPKEHEKFCKEWKLDIPLLIVKDFFELTAWLGGCKFFMGNQSFCFQLVEGIKVPRILETYNLMPNVIPIGEHAYDIYHQDTLQYYFNKLMTL